MGIFMAFSFSSMGGKPLYNNVQVHRVQTFSRLATLSFKVPGQRGYPGPRSTSSYIIWEAVKLILKNGGFSSLCFKTMPFVED